MQHLALLQTLDVGVNWFCSRAVEMQHRCRKRETTRGEFRSRQEIKKTEFVWALK